MYDFGSRRKVILFSLEAMMGDLAEPLPIEESSPNPQQMAEQKELHNALLQAVNTLSHRNRLATLLFYHEQLSLQEVADRLNISVSAVKGRLHKSRHQLRKRLSPLHDRIQPTSLQEIQTMTTNTSIQIKPKLCCSFCSKSSEQVNILIAGPGVFICNECVAICNQILSGEIPPSPSYSL